MGSKKRRRFREILKQDMEEVLKELGEKDLKVVEGEQDDAEALKKKRRRQKKGKQKDSQEEKDTQAEKHAEEVAAKVDMQPNKKGDEAMDEPHEDDGKSKRKRKKKGRKTQKQEEAIEAQGGHWKSVAATVGVSKLDEMDEVSKQDSVILEADATMPKKKKHKKKKKKKAFAIEGVSASRLASYNL